MKEVQSVVFKNVPGEKVWKYSSTRWWLSQHDFKPIKAVHRVYRKGEPGRKITQYRWRIKDPDQYKSFTTKSLPDNIDLIIGFKKDA